MTRNSVSHENGAKRSCPIRGTLEPSLVSENEFQVLAPKGTKLSIFSFEEAGVFTSGLKWNLNGTLGFSSRGISNETIDSEFSISTDGCVFVMIHES